MCSRCYQTRVLSLKRSGDVGRGEHVHEPIHLPQDTNAQARFDVGDDRHPRKPGAQRVRLDDESFDVCASCAQNARDPHQRARLVFQHYFDELFHYRLRKNKRPRYG